MEKLSKTLILLIGTTFFLFFVTLMKNQSLLFECTYLSVIGQPFFDRPWWLNHLPALTMFNDHVKPQSDLFCVIDEICFSLIVVRITKVYSDVVFYCYLLFNLCLITVECISEPQLTPQVLLIVIRISSLGDQRTELSTRGQIHPTMKKQIKK